MQRSQLGAPALCLVLGLVAASCGPGGDEDADASATPAPEASSSVPPTPSAEPAFPDGRVIDLEVATVRLPRSWRVSEWLGNVYKFEAPPTEAEPGYFGGVLGAYPVAGDLDETDEVRRSLDEIERRWTRSARRAGDDLDLLERVEVNGVPMARSVSTTVAGLQFYQLGAEYEDKLMNLSFGVPGDSPPPIEDERVEQVLSTIEWGEDQP